MSNQNDQNVRLNRRQALITGSGILGVGSGLSCNAIAQFVASPASKEVLFRTKEPRNAEPRLESLVQSWLTPTKFFYIRSHAPNPSIDASQYRLSIEGDVRHPCTLSLDELRQFSEQKVTATLTCAGNRRSEFNREGKVGGVQWEAGAIGNAVWGGVPLSSVLKKVEILESAKHVWFEGLDEIKRDSSVIPFGASIPIQKAMSDRPVAGTLLATKMNDEPLAADHGYPLRTVVPGYIGARSVKWLGRIVVSDRPSPNHYQATAYKLVKKTEPLDWNEAGPIYRYPINAAICSPSVGATVKHGRVRVAGYVLPTGRPGAAAKEVYVSANQGGSWQPATLDGEPSPFCWQLWNTMIDVTDDIQELWVKATDSSGGFMPARVAWNAKGYLQNAWYKSPINTG